MIPAICVNPSATDRRSEPAGQTGGRGGPRDRGAHGRHAARPTREEDRVDGGRAEARRGDAIARRPVQPICPGFDGTVEIGARRRDREARLEKGQRHGRSVLGAQRDLGVLHGKRQAMAEPLAHHVQKTFHFLGFARQRDQLGERALVLVGVGEVDRRPGGKLVIERVRHRQVLLDQLRAEAQQRHHRSEAERGVEVGAADAHAGVREHVPLRSARSRRCGPTRMTEKSLVPPPMSAISTSSSPCTVCS